MELFSSEKAEKAAGRSRSVSPGFRSNPSLGQSKTLCIDVTPQVAD